MTAPAAARLRVCDGCGEWTDSPQCEPCRPGPQPWPEHTILVRLPCGHRVDGPACDYTVQPEPQQRRLGYVWQGQRLVRVPIRTGGAS